MIIEVKEMTTRQAACNTAEIETREAERYGFTGEERVDMEDETAGRIEAGIEAAGLTAPAGKRTDRFIFTGAELTHDLHDLLKGLARRNKRTIAAEVRKALVNHLFINRVINEYHPARKADR